MHSDCHASDRHQSSTVLSSTAKEGDQGTAALPYRFVFYLHQSSLEGQPSQPPQRPETGPQPSEPVPDGLHKVSLTLPPPARKDYAQPDQLPAATQASISKLLSACGLQRYNIAAQSLVPGACNLRRF